MALSLGYVCWGHHRRARGTEQEQSDRPPSLLLQQRLDPVFQRDGAEIFSASSLAMQRASIEAAAALISSGNSRNTKRTFSGINILTDGSETEAVR
jgi:hypothetical protein